MAQPGGPKRSVPNVYPAKRHCECDRPLPAHGACVKCGHELPGMRRMDLGETAMLADLIAGR